MPEWTLQRRAFNSAWVVPRRLIVPRTLLHPGLSTLWQDGRGVRQGPTLDRGMGMATTPGGDLEGSWLAHRHGRTWRSTATPPMPPGPQRCAALRSRPWYRSTFLTGRRSSQELVRDRQATSVGGRHAAAAGLEASAGSRGPSPDREGASGRRELGPEFYANRGRVALTLSHDIPRLLSRPLDCALPRRGWGGRRAQCSGAA